MRLAAMSSPSEIVIDSEIDTDSAYSENPQSETTSLRSSVFNYHYENGRRYHAYHSGSYWYKEQFGLDECDS